MGIDGSIGEEAAVDGRRSSGVVSGIEVEVRNGVRLEGIEVGLRRRLLLTPVLDGHPLHPLELASVGRYECQPARSGLSGNENIVRSDRGTRPGERGSDLPGVAAVFSVELDDLETQRVNRGHALFPPAAPVRAVVRLV